MSTRFFKAASLALALAACGDDAATTTPVNSGVARPNTRVLSAQGRAALESFGADGKMVFAATDETMALAAGQIVASEPTDAARYGVLRRVVKTSIDNGKVVVETIPARLTEALKEAEFHIEGTLDGAKIDNVVTSALSIHVPFEKVLADADGNDATTDDQVRINAEFNLDAGFGLTYSLYDTDALFDDWNPFDGFELKIGASLGFEENASVGITLPKQVAALNLSEEVYTSYFEPITFFIGPVPVVLVPALSVEAKVEAAADIGGQSYGASQAVHASIGFECTLDGCGKKGGDLGADWNTQLPSIEDFRLGGHVKGALVPKVELLAYGVAGPFVSADVAAQLNVSPLEDPSWTLVGSIVGHVGLAGDILGISWSGIEFLSVSKELARSENERPRVALSVTPSAILGSKTPITPWSFDPEQGALPITLDVMQNGVSLQQVVAESGKATALELPYGDNDIVATVVDAGGKMDQTIAHVKVQDPAPDVALSAPVADVVALAGYHIQLIATAHDGFGQGGLVPCENVKWTSNVAADVLPENGCTSNGALYAVLDGVGDHTLRVTAVDAHGSDFEEVVVHVEAAPPGPIANPMLTAPNPGLDNIVALGMESSLDLAFTLEGNKPNVAWSWEVAYCGGTTSECDPYEKIAGGVANAGAIEPITAKWDAVATHGDMVPCGAPDYYTMRLVIDGKTIATFLVTRSGIC